MNDTDWGDHRDDLRNLPHRVRSRPIALVPLGPSCTTGAPTPYATR